MSAKGGSAFERACDLLARHTPLTSPQARGSLRLALKSAGLEPATVTPLQLAVVFRSIMVGKLQAQGMAVGDAAGICSGIAKTMDAVETAGVGMAAVRMFERLDRATGVAPEKPPDPKDKDD